ncbi:hypothetical protein OOK60_04855 [Trichothermofontia sichuanensis B231]|uniref:hypothetical protein n=1 Tax=Trichothermofontia sichuanensis TaxID=3045816 RepID=UPI002246D4B1|nr:hypothetical protein [Trichothermofontia sichuanensis]UZQ55407.1 hypothetical protein OOK60_04855 [Trichothermofontia sichuanensis B231]
MNLISRNPTSKDRVVTLNTWERLLAALCLTGMLAIANNVAEMELRSNWLDSWLTQEGLIRLPSGLTDKSFPLT